MAWDAWLGVLWEETAKAVPSAVTGLFLLALGWLVTARITAFWDHRKKERELGLAALERFYDLYGEFFAVWKLWETLLPRVGPLEPEKTKDRMDLLQRAAAVEGGPCDRPRAIEYTPRRPPKPRRVRCTCSCQDRVRTWVPDGRSLEFSQPKSASN